MTASRGIAPVLLGLYACLVLQSSAQEDATLDLDDFRDLQVLVDNNDTLTEHADIDDGSNCTLPVVTLESFLAVRLAVGSGGPSFGGGDQFSQSVDELFSQPSLDSFLEVTKLAYTEVASSCSSSQDLDLDLNRQVDEVELLTQFSSQPIVSAGEIEIVLRLAGPCPGCDSSLSALLEETELLLADQPEGFAFGGFGFPAMENRRLEDCGESCPAPSAESFLGAWNQRLDMSSLPMSISVVSAQELLARPDSQICDATLDGSDTSQEGTPFTTYLAIRADYFGGTTNPSTSFVEAMRQALQDAFVDQNSATAGVCDPFKRKLVSVAVEDGGGIGRQRQLDTDSSLDRRLQLSTTNSGGLVAFDLGVEFVFRVEATCLGCDGKLLGNSDLDIVLIDKMDMQDLENQLCICPVEISASGVGILPLQQALTRYSATFAENIYDVAEVEPVGCPSQEESFNSIVQVEFTLKAGASFPTDNEILTIQNGFVAAFNLIARLFCDPLVRRIASTQLVRTSELMGPFAMEDETITFELDVVGTCRGCDPEDVSLYDSISILTGIQLGGERNRRLNELVKRFSEAKASPDHTSARLRGLQPGFNNDSVCYCDVLAVPDQGPSEVDVIATYTDLIELLDLPNIKGVADCKALTLFTTSVILNFKGNAQNATDAELLALGQGFIDSYNRINSGTDVICDRQFRRLDDFQVNADIELNEEFLQAGGLSGTDQTNPGQRRFLLSKRVLQRRGQEITVPITVPSNGSSQPSVSPSRSPAPTVTAFPSSIPMSQSSAPSIEIGIPATEAPTSVFDINVDTSVNVLLSVQGTCRGCSNNLSLFNQVSARRRLQLNTNEDQSTIDLDFLTAAGSCFCPLGASQAAPSEDLVLEVFEETIVELREEGEVTFVEEVQELEEVTVVQCSLETNGFETQVVVDFLGFFELINQDDLDAVRATFNNTYNGISQTFCDELFRRSRGVGDIEFRQVSGVDSDGLSRIRFTLSILGQCRDCQAQDGLFGDSSAPNSRRQMQEEELCFCDSESAGTRAPTGDEFLKEYENVWAELSVRRGRRGLQAGSGLNLKTPVFAGSDEPLTDDPSSMPSPIPSLSPSSTVSFSPSSTPLLSPSSAPSLEESESPSADPSSPPTESSSGFPSTFPSSFPSTFPSVFPSSFPSVSPSSVPSRSASISPSLDPTIGPSVSPSGAPSSQPSQGPTAVPSGQPSDLPSGQPSDASSSPSTSPSLEPTLAPSDAPTDAPSNQPSQGPTVVPSVQPSESPSTSEPSQGPTAVPSVQPSESPSTSEPSQGPTAVPSVQPSESPSTSEPSVMPSGSPTLMPSSNPSHNCETGNLAAVRAFCATSNCCEDGSGTPGVGCSWDASDINTVCANSCIGNNACVWNSGVQGVRVFSESCNGLNACANWSGSNHVIEADSCTGTSACANWSGSSNTIRINACNGNSACLAWTQGAHTVGTGSCLRGSSCNNWGGNNNVIGTNSCTTFADVPSACANWPQGSHRVGNNSCRDFSTNTVPCEGWQGAGYQIGDNSCIRSQACRAVDAASLQVGTNSCSGPQACQNIGGTDPSTVTVGDQSCQGDDACQSVGDVTLGKIDIGGQACVGNRACQTVLQSTSFAVDITIASNACDSDDSCQNVLKFSEFEGAASVTIDATCTGTLCQNCLDSLCTLPFGSTVISETFCSPVNPCVAAGFIFGGID